MSCDVPECPEKRYGTSPGSGTNLPPFLALGRFKFNSSFLVSYHDVGSLVWSKSELEWFYFTQTGLVLTGICQLFFFVAIPEMIPV